MSDASLNINVNLSQVRSEFASTMAQLREQAEAALAIVGPTGGDPEALAVASRTVAANAPAGLVLPGATAAEQQASLVAMSESAVKAAEGYQAISSSLVDQLASQQQLIANLDEFAGQVIDVAVETNAVNTGLALIKSNNDGYLASIVDLAAAQNTLASSITSAESADSDYIASTLQLSLAQKRKAVALLGAQVADTEYAASVDDLTLQTAKLKSLQDIELTGTADYAAELGNVTATTISRSASDKLILAANDEYLTAIGQDALASKALADAKAAAIERVGLGSAETGAQAGGSSLLGITGAGGLTGQIPQLAAVLGITIGVKDVVQSTLELQKTFAQLQVQLNSIGEGGDLPKLKQQVDSIAESTGVSATAIASSLPQLVGAFQSAGDAARAAGEAAQIAQIDNESYASSISQLIPLSAAFKQSFSELNGEALKVQDSFGVSASRVLQFFSAAAPLAAQYGLTLQQLGALGGAALKDINTSPQSVAEDLNRTVLPNLSKQLAGTIDQLQQTTAGRAIIPQLTSDVGTGQEGQALQLLIDNYGKLSKAQQDAIGQAVGGTRGTKDFAAALQDTAQVQNFLADTTSATAREQAAWIAQQSTLTQQLKDFEQTLLALGRDGFQQILPVFNQIISGLQQIAAVANLAQEALSKIPGSSGSGSNQGIHVGGITIPTSIAGIAADVANPFAIPLEGIKSDVSGLFGPGGRFGSAKKPDPKAIKALADAQAKDIANSSQAAADAVSAFDDGTGNLADAINKGQLAIQTAIADKGAGSNEANKALAAQGKLKADNLLKSQNLAESTQPATTSQDFANRITQETGLFQSQSLQGPGTQADQLTLAQTIVKNLQSELQAEADVATTTAQKNKILRDGLAIPDPVKGVLASSIVANDADLSQFFDDRQSVGLAAINDLETLVEDIVGEGKSVGDALVEAARIKLAQAALSGDSVDIYGLQRTLTQAQGLQGQLNSVGGVGQKVTGPPTAQPKPLSGINLDIANAQLQAANDAGNPIQAAKDAQTIAADQLSLAKSDGDQAAVFTALEAQAAAAKQLAAAQSALIVAHDNYQAAQDSNDPVKAAQDARQLANDQLAAATALGDQAAQQDAQTAQFKAAQQLALAQQAIGLSQINLTEAQLSASGDVVGAAKEQVVALKQQIQNAISNKDGVSTLNGLYAQLTAAEANVTTTQISFQEQQIKDNLDLQRITVGQAVGELRSLESVATSQQQRDQIELQVKQLLNQTANLQYNLPTDINLPVLYEARRLNQTPAGTGYADNRNISIVLNAYNNTDVAGATQQIVAAVNSRAFTTTGSLY